MPEHKQRFQEPSATVAHGTEGLAERRQLAHELLDQADAWVLFCFYEDHTGDSTLTMPPALLPGMLSFLEEEMIPQLIFQIGLLREQLGPEPERMND